MQFGNPIVGGAGSLVRQSIHSPDYVPGVSGWSINKDGTAEFNSTTIRGDLLVVGANDSRVWIHEATDGSATIELYVPSTDPLVNPGSIDGRLPFPDLPELRISGPSYGNTLPLNHASIGLRNNNTVDQSVIDIRADQLTIGESTTGLSGQMTLSHDNIVSESLRILTTNEVRSNVSNPFSLVEPWCGLKSGAFYEANGNGAAVTSQSFYDDAAVVTASTGFVADPGSATAGLVFNRPASGKVVIDWAALLTNSGANFNLVSWEIRLGSTVGSGTIVFTTSDNRAIEHAGTASATASSFYEASLPGNSTSVFNIRLMYRTGGGSISAARRRMRVTPVLY